MNDVDRLRVITNLRKHATNPEEIDALGRCIDLLGAIPVSVQAIEEGTLQGAENIAQQWADEACLKWMEYPTDPQVEVQAQLKTMQANAVYLVTKQYRRDRGL